MANLSIGQLLRYVYAGALAILAAAVADGEVAGALPKLTGVGEAAGLGVAAMVAGAMIYVLHRALLYPVFYLVLVSLSRWCPLLIAGNVSVSPSLPARNAPALDIARWIHRYCDNPPSLSGRKLKAVQQPKNSAAAQRKVSWPTAASVAIVRGLEEWGHQVHMLYCCAWAVVVGGRAIPAVVRVAHQHSNPPTSAVARGPVGLDTIPVYHESHLLRSAFLLFIVAAVVHHVRYLRRELYALLKLPTQSWARAGANSSTTPATPSAGQPYGRSAAS